MGLCSYGGPQRAVTDGQSADSRWRGDRPRRACCFRAEADRVPRIERRGREQVATGKVRVFTI